MKVAAKKAGKKKKVAKHGLKKAGLKKAAARHRPAYCKWPDFPGGDGELCLREPDETELCSVHLKKALRGSPNLGRLTKTLGKMGGWIWLIKFILNLYAGAVALPSHGPDFVKSPPAKHGKKKRASKKAKR